MGYFGRAAICIAGAERGRRVRASAEQPTVAAGPNRSRSWAQALPNERVATWATAPDQAVIGGSYAERQEPTVRSSSRSPHARMRSAGGIDRLWQRQQDAGRDSFEGDKVGEALPRQRVAAPKTIDQALHFAFAVGLATKKMEKLSYWFTGPGTAFHDASPEGAEANRLAKSIHLARAARCPCVAP